MTKLRTVALLARKPGLLVLDALLDHPRVDLRHVLTHSLLPKSEGGLERPEMAVFYEKCLGRLPSVPISHIDGAHEDENTAGFLRRHAPFDLLLVLNWRNKISQEVLDMAHHKINIHRGDLPKYPGARPIKQAIDAGEKYVAITAHRITADIDAGAPLAKIYAPVVDGFTMGREEDYTRDSLEPLYAPLTRMVLEMVT